MKYIILACSMGAALIAGPAFAQDTGATIDPSLIIRTNGSGLDAWSASEGNDKAGGMWEGATGYSAAVQRPSATETVPANRQWSRLDSRERHHRQPSY
ncbi:hypothetical protein SAMN02799622_05393 [Methylobacterium sp. UNC378MF]|uniref:hypothetical protein n=1 Tax=Methylobacterium sp. UNC378MF TaxID=1502748 RepID=UPI00087F0942|nr:hypothetical protein [Methylobacterium sp. UNC378MF]SDA32964.1 hypothetical protein SAMN02799622_05393 [Methylobacterium sp. UNC378MF]